MIPTTTEQQLLEALPPNMRTDMSRHMYLQAVLTPGDASLANVDTCAVWGHVTRRGGAGKGVPPAIH